MPEYHVRTRTLPGVSGAASYETSATWPGAVNETTSGTAQPFSAPAVRPPASQRSLRKNKTMMGTVRMTEPAISTVVGTSMLPDEL